MLNYYFLKSNSHMRQQQCTNCSAKNLRTDDLLAYISTVNPPKYETETLTSAKRMIIKN